MKIDAKQLRSMIAEVVREELRNLAPVIVEEFLTEKYIRGIMKESRGRVSEDAELDDLEDHIPRPPKNDHEGVYSGKTIDRNNEIVNKLLAKDNPFAAIYEGVKPIPSGGAGPTRVVSETQAQFGEEGIPIDQLPGFSKRMTEMVRKMDQKSSGLAPMKQTASAEERRIAEMRAKLDQQVVNVSRPKVG